MNRQPPKLFLRFLRWFCHPDLVDPIEGDLIELYDERLKASGRLHANTKLAADILLLLRPNIIKTLQGTQQLNLLGMFNNYLKVGFRNILKYKSFSLINVFGLAVAMAVSLVIMLMLNDQYSYDQFHQNRGQIYRVLTKFKDSSLPNGPSPYPLASALQQQYPFVESATHLLRKVGGDMIHQQSTNRNSTEVRGFITDPNFFQVFDFQLEQGDARKALQSPNTVVITRAVADRLFPEENPVGKIVAYADRGLELIKIDIGNVKEDTPQDWGFFTITGVIDMSQYKSHIRFDMLIADTTLPTLQENGFKNNDEENWKQYSNVYTYVKLMEGSQRAKLDAALAELTTTNYQSTVGLETMELLSQSMNEIITGSFVGAPLSLRLPSEAYIVLFVLALIIMCSACLNYTNLSLARVLTRVREIGVRKVNGASRWHLVFQFLTESVLISLLALAMANLLLLVLKPTFSNLWINEVLSFNLSLNFTILGIFLLFAVLVGLIAGLYPSLVLSGFTPLKALKDFSGGKTGKNRLRKMLSVTQFAFSLFFIITSLLIGRQFDYIMHYEYGFNTADVWNIPVQGNDYRLLQQEFSTIPGVTGVSASEFVPALLYTNGASIRLPEEDIPHQSETLGIDHHFISNMGLELIAGTGFTSADANAQKVIVNESAARILGFEDNLAAVGQSIEALRGTYVITGIVKDFKFQAPIMGNGETPLVMHYHPEIISYLNLRTAPSDRKAMVNLLAEKWESMDEIHPFKAYAYEDQLQRANQMVSDLVWVIRVITLLSLIISCMGLLGVAMYTAERKTKEVGIRKVLGASGIQLMKLVGKSYAIIMLLACLIAAPLSYLINVQWLESFPNRVEFGLGTILLGIVIMLLLALLTIGSQLLKVSRKNPVDSLRYE